MKTISISTENSETYSSISNFFIDYYMTEANGEFVKVYLYLVRLLNKNSKIAIADIADHFNLTEKDICRAIKYWISKDVLKLNYNGRGNLNGIVLLPLKNPSSEIHMSDTDMIAMLMSDDSEQEAESDAESGQVAGANLTSNSKKAKVLVAATAATSDTEIAVPPKEKLSKEDIDRKSTDEDWSDIVYQVETLFGKTVSSRDTETLMYIYDGLKFNIDLFEYLIEYCVTMGKKSIRYMEAVAIAWYKDGIKTSKEAREQAFVTSNIAKMIFKTLGIRYHNLTPVESAYIDTWTKDMGFSYEMIEQACERAVIASPNSANFAYLNGILDNWHKNKARTLKDVEELDKQFAANKKQSIVISGKKGSGSSGGAGGAGGFNDFPQTSLDGDLAEMEKLLLKEVNNS